MVDKYISELFKTYIRGDAREESYYGSLEDLLKHFAESNKKRKIHITTLPKKTEAGNPDFRVWDGKQKIVGYIEAKDLGTDLDKIEDTEQLERYLSTFPNVILTNFTEFRLYRDGERVAKVFVARPFVIHKLKTVPPLENEKEFFELLDRFLSFSLPKTFSARTLAVELAKRTRFLKEEIISEELKTGTETIHSFYEAFKEFLIAGISKEEFADLYAQTITYGLFAARLRANNEFNRKLAFDFIPKTIGILRDIFKFISMEDIPIQMEVIIDDIAEVLAAAEAKKILDQYYREGKGSDPVLHFYETFLEVYDPKTREKRGVYYTPEPVVSFIVRSLHQILKDKFGISEGLAGENVTLLDPAGGTLGFIAQAIQVAVNEFENKYGKGAVKNFLKDRILENYYAFELMMAPYAIGHLKISFLLEELGYRMDDKDRVKYFLTNTLDMKELEESKFPGMSSLSNESHEAGKIKKQVPILVILGNPPYSVSSANVIQKGSEFYELYESYKEEVRKEEKNIQPLSDDYIKFIAFAHWKIVQAGKGIVGMITNNSYLDGLIHRDMRRKIVESFDEVYILNLHGSSKRKEVTPKGEKDENVFDIQQGVSIILLVKDQVKNKKIRYFDLWGLREGKYKFLETHDVNNTKWQELEPKGPYYFFVPKDFRSEKTYDKFVSLTTIFEKYNVGIATGKDDVLVGFDKQSLIRKLSIKDKNLFEITMISYRVDKNLIEKWYLELKNKDIEKQIKPYNYRLFDLQFTIYNSKILQRVRETIMQHLLSDNYSLVTTKILSSPEFKHAFISAYIGDRCFISNRGQEANYFFPLYLYTEENPKRKNFNPKVMMLFEEKEKYKFKKPNIKPEIFDKLNKAYFGHTPPLRSSPLERGQQGCVKEVTPEEIFYYIYAVLYSNTYRTKYAEFLKIDFPRVPFTKNYKLFIKLGKLGKQLADLHLLKSQELEKPKSKFPVEGSNKIEKPRYDNGRVYINNDQYFDGIRENVWNYQIGGYQVCNKWLKDRKERTLSLEDIQIYCKIVTALSKTIEIQKEIDGVYPGLEDGLNN